MGLRSRLRGSDCSLARGRLCRGSRIASGGSTAGAHRRCSFCGNGCVVAGGLIGNIGVSDLAAEARSRVNADILPLPVFRRKRFDVNFESLKTGHVYGVYFDICRTVDSPAEHSFGQVEVEYCRSRTAFLLDDIFEEFNFLAKYVERLLSEKKVAYKEDLFSKLDFSRQSRSKNNIPE